MLLSSLSLFSNYVRTSSPASNQNVYFSKKADCCGNTGHFLESELVGMLEGSGFDSIDRVLLFLGVGNEVFRGIETTANVTVVVTKYGFLVNVLFRRYCQRLDMYWYFHALKHDQAAYVSRQNAAWWISNFFDGVASVAYSTSFSRQHLPCWWYRKFACSPPLKALAELSKDIIDTSLAGNSTHWVKSWNVKLFSTKLKKGNAFWAGNIPKLIWKLKLCVSKIISLFFHEC